MITQDYINKYKAKFGCALSCLATQYTDALYIGSSCADTIGMDMIIANNLIKVLCITKGDELDNCLTDDQICTLIEGIKRIFKLNKCNCQC